MIWLTIARPSTCAWIRTSQKRTNSSPATVISETTLDTPPYLGSVLNGEPFANTAYTRNQNGVVSEVHTFSPNTINEARIGVNRVRTDWDAYGANQDTSQQVGIPGINDFCGFCGGLPRISYLRNHRQSVTPRSLPRAGTTRSGNTSIMLRSLRGTPHGES